jgi:asparagine synthase (glutamine-hydrolysing)
MCGIVGVLYRNGDRPEESTLRRMTDKLQHRGPDGFGVKLFPQAALGHRRLAVIDLSTAAAQPLSDHSDSVYIAFNGEIYNFRALRAELEQAGYAFKTRGDTEVIVNGYLAWGHRVVDRLDGMFAFAIWDSVRQTLVLARDRTGKKPLFVYEDPHRLVFASELKGLLAHPGLDTRENPEAIAQYLTHGYVPSPATWYARIRTVRPATVEIHPLHGASTERTYWDFPLGRERRLESREDVEEATHTVRNLFFKAVERRLVSDVPLGAFLSGGIDSSLVVAVMARLSSKPVRTFSIGFEGHPDWDETRFAQLVAQRYATTHTEFKVRPDSLGLLEKIAWHYDQPFGDSSCIPTYVVSKLTREHVTVALTGDGGDEVFAGYSRFLGASVAERVPRFIRNLVHRLAPMLPQSRQHHGPWERTRRLALAVGRELPDRLRGWMSFFSPAELRELLVPEVARYVNEAVLGESYQRLIAHARSRGADVVNQVLYANARTYLLDDLNVKTDIASMAVGLETRSPFLDTALMEFSFSLPGSAKLRGRTTKWLLKRAFRDFLPEEIFNRPKMGFGVPLGAWFRGSGLDELRRPRSPALFEVVRQDALERLLQRHEAGTRDLGPQIFLLKMLDLFLSRAGRPQPVVSRST